MAWTTPRTWVTSEIVTAAQMNSHLRDNLNFLYTPPACRVFNSVAFSVPHNSTTPVTFNSERFDTDTMHDTATNPDRITANTLGKYMVGGCFDWATSTAGIRDIDVDARLSVVVVLDRHEASSVGATRQAVATLYDAGTGHALRLRAYQNSGAALSINSQAERSPEFWAIWVGN